MVIFKKFEFLPFCRTLFIGIFFSVPLLGPAQSIHNTRTKFDQSKQLFLIQFDLKNLNYKYEIQVYPTITLKDGTVPTLTNISGDLGWLRRNGAKTIVWDPFKDGITSFEDLQITFQTLKQKLILPRFWGLEIQGSNSAYLGLKGARLAPIGYYAGFRIGKLPPSFKYSISAEGVNDFDDSGIYEVGKKTRIASYSFTAGPVFQASTNTYGYWGIGFGAEQVFRQYQVYNLDKEPVSSQWAHQKGSNNQKGFSSEIGAIFRLNHFLIDVGFYTIKFKTFQFTAGFGYAFGNNQIEKQ